MDKGIEYTLTSSQFTLILIGSMIGVGILNLPNNVVEITGQDGWVACIFGALYPIYILFIANYISRKYPQENILILSQKCFGRILGNILNCLFISYFVFLITSVASGVTNVLTTYAIPFLSSYRVLALIFLVPAFIAYKNIKTLGKVNEVVFYATIMLFFIPISALKYGDLLNLRPIFGSGLMKIMMASKETFFAYAGIEIIFLIYPSIEDKKKLKKSGIISVLFTAIIYTYFTFITIFYLGIDIVPKFIWSIATVSESVYVPIINNFRYIFILMWTIIMFKTISNFYYSVSYSLSGLIKSVPKKNFVVLLYPIFFYISTKYVNTTIRTMIIDKVVPIYVVFNLLYISIIAILISVKKGDGYEKKFKK